MSTLKTVAISLGDINGVGIHIALLAHKEVSKLCQPLYCISQSLLEQASALLNIPIPDDFYTVHVEGDFTINPGVVDKNSGAFSFASFHKGIELCEKNLASALLTLPIHKEAWMSAGLEHKGHTDYLRKHFDKKAIMMLGCEKMYVALFTEHLPLKDVASKITSGALSEFLIDFHKETKASKVAVLGLNPHAGDNGVLGNEELEIIKAINTVNQEIGEDIFEGPLVPDVAFTPRVRENYRYYVAMYHDQGLAPLKALYFDEGINVSLNLPIVRTSVDHGTAFDIAYKSAPLTLSYINALKEAITLSQR